MKTDAPARARRHAARAAIIGVLLIGVAGAGCAARARGRSPFLRGSPGQGAVTVRLPAAARPALEAYISRVRELSAAALKRKTATVRTVEMADPELRRALAALTAGADPRAHLDVSAAYARLGIRDLAFDHLAAAAALDPHSAAAWDGMARIWRDWGFAGFALPDAYRAVHCAPASAEAHNTLGTVLQIVGQVRAARAEYSRATKLNPQAAWAWSNLCNLAAVHAASEEGLEACRRAVALDPRLTAAQRNLAALEQALGRPAASAAELRAHPPAPSRTVVWEAAPAPSLARLATGNLER